MDRTTAPSPPPRSRDGGAPWALFFVILALLGVAIGVTIFTLVRAGSKAKSAPLGSANAGGSPSARGDTALPNAPAHPPPLPESLSTTETTAPRGTPASSLRARPTWGLREHLTPHAKVTSQYAPQLTNPLEAFLAATPLGPDFAEGTLICRFQSFNKHDTFAGDDLHARVTFGATPEVANDGPEDGNLAFVSAPLVHLAKGERIAYQVFDRDVFGITAMSTSAVTFTGIPVVAMDSGAAVECRGISGASLANAIATRAAAATITLAEIERSKPDETRADWGFPAEPLQRAERQIADTAALAGWDEPGVHERVGTLETLTARARTAREELFDRLYTSAGTTMKLGPMTVTVTEASAEPGRVPIAVKNAGAVAASFGDHHTTFYVATRRGGPAWAQLTTAPGTAGVSVKLEPGETRAEQIATMGSLPEGTLLLAACTGRTCGFARAR